MSLHSFPSSHQPTQVNSFTPDKRYSRFGVKIDFLNNFLFKNILNNYFLFFIFNINILKLLKKQKKTINLMFFKINIYFKKI